MNTFLRWGLMIYGSLTAVLGIVDVTTAREEERSPLFSLWGGFCGSVRMILGLVTVILAYQTKENGDETADL